MIILNRKGQLGKGLTVLPVLVLVLVILLLYYGLTFGISTFKRVTPPSLQTFELGESPLLKQVRVIVDGNERKVFFLEAFLLYRAGKVGRADFEKSMQQLLSAELPCFAFASGMSEHPARSSGEVISLDGVQTLEMNSESPTLGIPKYSRAGVLQEISFMYQGKNIYVESYLGRCL